MFIARFVSFFRSSGAVCEKTLHRLNDSLYSLGGNLRHHRFDNRNGWTAIWLNRVDAQSSRMCYKTHNLTECLLLAKVLIDRVDLFFVAHTASLCRIRLISNNK